MMRSIAIFALAMVMSSVSQAKVVELEYKSAQGQGIEAVSSQMILPAHNDLFVISIAGLDRKLRTVVYNGDQLVYFVPLSRDADFPIKIETTTIHPGQTRQLTIDLGENGSQAMHIPIETVYAAEGEAEIMVEVPQLTSRYD
ncbi:hypothetical protein [uncultured Photobacterium sp.]|uniref:hypothetical protein n=1 Tax=uncultured Photobacterium sp. TaxID=173973 RepID=UPI00261847FF|nr:hypothetical protein [uncultured Photobacterium sp.]